MAAVNVRFTPDGEHRRVRHFGRKTRDASPYLWFTAAQPAFEPDQCCPSQIAFSIWLAATDMASCSSPNDLKAAAGAAFFLMRGVSWAETNGSSF
jgi:hypothetical protein